jgi:hypothetical protein
MKKQIITMMVAAAAVMSSTVASAQLNFGGRAGLNLANQVGDVEESSMLTSFYVGAALQLDLGDKLFLAPELNFSIKGAADKSTSSFDILGTTTKTEYDAKIKTSYIEVPVNIGFRIADDEGYNIFIFHDVDLLPGDKMASYYVKNPEIPIHIARCWDRYKGQEYLGGIISISKKNFIDLNGYPNNYWGWGGEDDELRRRVNELNLQIENPKEEDCEITDLEGMNLQEKLQVLKENQDWKNMKKRELKEQHSATWKDNGVNSIEGEYLSLDDWFFLWHNYTFFDLLLMRILYLQYFIK